MSRARTWLELANPSLDERPVSELLQTALNDARDLIRAEVALAKEEAGTEAKHAGASLFLLLLGVATAAFTLAGLVIGILALTRASPPVVALVFAAVMATVTGAALLLARWLMPGKVLERTRGRVEDDIQQLKDGLS